MTTKLTGEKWEAYWSHLCSEIHSGKKLVSTPPEGQSSLDPPAPTLRIKNGGLKALGQFGRFSASKIPNNSTRFYCPLDGREWTEMFKASVTGALRSKLVATKIAETQRIHHMGVLFKF